MLFSKDVATLDALDMADWLETEFEMRLGNLVICPLYEIEAAAVILHSANRHL